MEAQIDRSAIRRRSRYRIRRKMSGTATRPRLAVFRSLKHIYVQAINDENGQTMARASTMDKELAAARARGGNCEAAKQVGASIAERLKSVGVETIVFDRGGNLYHGRIKALAEAAREGGLKF